MPSIISMIGSHCRILAASSVKSVALSSHHSSVIVPDASSTASATPVIISVCCQRNTFQHEILNLMVGWNPDNDIKDETLKEDQNRRYQHLLETDESHAVQYLMEAHQIHHMHETNPEIKADWDSSLALICTAFNIHKHSILYCSLYICYSINVSDQLLVFCFTNEMSAFSSPSKRQPYAWSHLS